MHTRRAIGLAAFAEVALLCGEASGQCTSHWFRQHGSFGIDAGRIEDTMFWDPDGPGPQAPLFVAVGDFISAGGNELRDVAAWNGAAWQKFGVGLNGQLHAVAEYNGQLVAAGSISDTQGGQTLSNIARWDGSIWKPLGFGLDNLVFDLEVYQGEMYAGGHFTAANLQPVGYIARWNGAQWSPVGTGADYSVIAMALHGGDLVAAGLFQTAGGVPAAHVAAWDGVSWEPVGGGLPWPALALHAHAGVLYASMSQVATVSTVMRWDGASWEQLGPPLQFSVGELIVHAGELVAAGAANYGAPGSLARWNGIAWTPMGIKPRDSFTNTIIGALETSGSDLIISGTFATEAWAYVTRSARWNAGTWAPFGYTGFDGSVRTLRSVGGEVIAGGAFVHAASRVCNGIARHDGTIWQPLGDGLTGPAPAEVRDLEEYGGDLVAGGTFTHSGPDEVKRIARWNEGDWHPLGPGLSLSAGGVMASVDAMAIFGDDLVAGGCFDSAGATTAQSIARWDGAAWHPLGQGFPGVAPTVHALTVHQGELIAGGDFRGPGTPGELIARWNGSVWLPLGGGIGGADPGMRPRVLTLGSFEGDLIAAGCFGTAGGGPANGIARWDGAAWHALGAGLEVPLSPLAGIGWSLAVRAGSLYVGGFFSEAGGRPASSVARWDGGSWSALNNGAMWGTGATHLGTVFTLLPHGESIIAGGDFSAIGSAATAHLAHYRCWCYPDCDFSGYVTIPDFACFQSLYLQGHPYADCNFDEALTIADFACFQMKFTAGCP